MKKDWAPSTTRGWALIDRASGDIKKAYLFFENEAGWALTLSEFHGCEKGQQGSRFGCLWNLTMHDKDPDSHVVGTPYYEPILVDLEKELI